MATEYSYKGYNISFNENRGDFSVVLNERTVRSSSLSGIRKQIDKHAVASFTPVEVLYLTHKNGKEYLLKTRLVSYHERRGTYRNSRELVRFFRTEEGEEITLNASYYMKNRIYPVSKREEVLALLKERDEQNKIVEAARKKSNEASDKRNKLAIDLSTLDPKAE